MSETQKLLADLARAKALFQRRAILIYMGVEQLPSPPAAMEDMGAGDTIDAQRAHDARRRG